MPPGTVYAFGPFELDAAARRLTRGADVISVSDRHLDVLLALVSNPGAVLSKDALVQAGWGDVAVTDNSLEQAISGLRRTLAATGGSESYIQTVPRRGYRFVGEVSRAARREDDASLEALLTPHRVWLEGRASLETLEREQVLHARRAFEQVLTASPDYAPAHIGLANACLFRFEATRADEMADLAALTEAVRHAREACRLDSQSAESWATLGLVLHRAGDTQQSLAAARRSVSLEPDNWRHHFRLAVVSWGEERLRAAQRTLALLPGLALAHWLAATVHVARQVLDRAEQELELGARGQDAQEPHARFSAVALHWLLGLVRLARGDEEGAVREFERELSFEDAGQLYARECCANTLYAIGAVMLRKGQRAAGTRAFERALERVPGHPMALAGLALAGDEAARAAVDRRVSALLERGLIVESAFATAALHIGGRAPERAAQIIQNALLAAPPGSAGWALPLEPLLHVTAASDVWIHALTHLRARAA